MFSADDPHRKTVLSSCRGLTLTRPDLKNILIVRESSLGTCSSSIVEKSRLLSHGLMSTSSSERPGSLDSIRRLPGKIASIVARAFSPSRGAHLVLDRIDNGNWRGSPACFLQFRAIVESHFPLKSLYIDLTFNSVSLRSTSSDTGNEILWAYPAYAHGPATTATVSSQTGVDLSAGVSGGLPVEMGATGNHSSSTTSERTDMCLFSLNVLPMSMIFNKLAVSIIENRQLRDGVPQYGSFGFGVVVEHANMPFDMGCTFYVKPKGWRRLSLPSLLSRPQSTGTNARINPARTFTARQGPNLDGMDFSMDTTRSLMEMCIPIRADYTVVSDQSLIVPPLMSGTVMTIHRVDCSNYDDVFMICSHGDLMCSIQNLYLYVIHLPVYRRSRYRTGTYTSAATTNVNSNAISPSPSIRRAIHPTHHVCAIEAAMTGMPWLSD